MESFSSFIKGIRQNLNLTQTQFAARIGVDSATISKIENGQKMPKEKLLPKISEEFRVDLNDLKVQYFSEKFANDLFEYNCPENTLKVAEKKFHFRLASNVKQSFLDL